MSRKNVQIEKALAEIPILQDFIDFVNRQVGVYMDCLSGFQGNTVRIHLQTARVQRPTGSRIKDGQPVIMYTSIEDPRSSDVIHHRIMRTNEFIRDNSEANFNEQQVCWSIIVFLFAYWDEEVRPQIAKARGVKTNDVLVGSLGDLRLVRNSIIHEKGVLSSRDHARLQKMAAIFTPGNKISLTHDQMHKLFIAVKQGIAEVLLTYTEHLPGAPDPSKIADIAIQSGNSRKHD